MRKKIVSALLVTALAAGAERLTAPVDSQAPKQLVESAKSARQEGNHASALRDYRRLLELFPNDPLVRAGVYAAMGDAAGKAGEAVLAKEYTATARLLDPKIEERVRSTEGSVTVSRGERGDTVSAFLSAALQAAAAIAQVNQQRRDAQRLAALALQQQIQAQQQQAQQGGAQPFPIVPGQPPPPQPMPPPGYVYPPAPVGQPGYQPPPAQPAYPQPAPVYPPQPGYAPPGQPAVPVYPPQPGYAPPGQPPAPVYQPQPGYAPPFAPQPVYQQPPPGYAAPPDPYAVAGYHPGVAVMRGEGAKPLRVVHDHSHAGDAAYFDTGCGALLSVDGHNLIFTAQGPGESPRVIPATEIWEIRLNTAVGKEVGAFHVSTRNGLYLNLATESGSRDDARAAIDSLRKKIGLVE